MFFVWGVLLPAFAASFLAGYLKRRQTGRSEGDWTFLRNRRALIVGGAVSLLLIALNITSISHLLLAVPPALLVGGVVAMAVNRLKPE
ncbi:hypothetical protein ACSMXN_22645 [Jatrophihabitans sp. DSM 45814]